jgi:hypothetical protein
MPERSIHVPASVVQTIKRTLAWMIPSASVVMSSVALGYRWLGDRASITEVGDRLAPVARAAEAAQAEAFHCSSVLHDEQILVNKAWAEVVLLHAELEVYRRYSSQPPQRRAELIEDARRTFSAEFADRLHDTPNDPAEAARLALLARWRP